MWIIFLFFTPKTNVSLASSNIGSFNRGSILSRRQNITFKRVISARRSIPFFPLSLSISNGNSTISLGENFLKHTSNLPLIIACSSFVVADTSSTPTINTSSHIIPDPSHTHTCMYTWPHSYYDMHTTCRWGVDEATRKYINSSINFSFFVHPSSSVILVVDSSHPHHILIPTPRTWHVMTPHPPVASCHTNIWCCCFFFSSSILFSSPLFIFSCASYLLHHRSHSIITSSYSWPPHPRTVTHNIHDVHTHKNIFIFCFSSSTVHRSHIFYFCCPHTHMCRKHTTPSLYHHPSTSIFVDLRSSPHSITGPRPPWGTYTRVFSSPSQSIKNK